MNQMKLVLVILMNCVLQNGTQLAFGTDSQETRQHVSTDMTPEKLLSRAIQAIGGRKALNQLESFQLHGVMRLSDDRPVVEIELATMQGGKVLGVMTYIGVGQSRFGSDGITAWEQNLIENNGTSWKIIDDKTLSQKVQQMNWLEWFTMLPSQLGDMTIIGTEVFDDETCWKISLQNGNSKEQLLFFSTETYRPRGRRTIEKMNNGNATVDIYFKEWERIGNLLLFHKVVFDRDGNSITMKLDRIEINSAEEYLFALPEPIIQLRDKQ